MQATNLHTRARIPEYLMNWQGGIKRGSQCFPVQVTLTAWLLYLVTLTHDVSLANLGLTSQLCGWDYQPLGGHPLWWLLTLPLRLLPADVIPLAANLGAATCAALALGLLAATLELMAWDRPLAELPRWSARLPLVLGVIVCGGEFNFWQAATAATGEALPILLLAAAIWCLAKYKVHSQLPWLHRACLLWGFGMAENWMMVLTLPLFAVAVLWLAIPRLITAQKLPRYAPTLLAFLSLTVLPPILYLLPPLVNGWWPHSLWTPGETCRAAWQAFKIAGIAPCVGLWRGYLPMVFVVLLFYLLPGLPVLFRLPDGGTRNLMRIDLIQVWLFRALRTGLLAACLWLAFDPNIGLRQLLHHQTGLALPLLSLDYLTGIGAAVLAGNLLLALFTDEVTHKRTPGPVRPRFQSWPILSVPAFAGILVVVLVGLLWRNLPAITRANRQPLAQFGELALAHLPVGGGIMLADDELRLDSFLAAAGSANRSWLAVNMASLANPTYRRWLAEKPRGAGFATTNQSNLTPPELVALLRQLAQTNRIFYLHPSFGCIFEAFYLEPVGLVYELKPLPPDTLQPPPLSAKSLAANEAIWDDTTSHLVASRGGQPLPPPNPDWHHEGGKHLYLTSVDSVQSRSLAGWYAMALNDWAGRLQQAGQLPLARHRLDQALTLNPDNLAAQLNRLVNSNLLASQPLNLDRLPDFTQRYGDPRRFTAFWETYGPVDEPAWCLLAGMNLRQAGLLRAAAQQFARANELIPHTADSLWELARTYSQLGQGPQARATLDRIRQTMPAALLKTNYNDARLSLLEATTWYAETNSERGRQVLLALGQEHPGDSVVTEHILEIWLTYHDWNNALQMLATGVAQTPDDPQLLNLQGAVLVQAGQPAAGLKVFDHLLTLTNLPAGRINHAAAQLVLGNYPAAAREYQDIVTTDGESAAVTRAQAILAHSAAGHAPLTDLRVSLAKSPSGPVLMPVSGPRP